MLIISRRTSESVNISPDPRLDPQTTIAELFKDGPITVTVTDIQRSQAKIGIEAPAQIHIVRSELITDQ